MAVPTWSNLLQSLLLDETADPAQLRWAMEQTLSGEASPSQIAAWLVALRARNVDAEDLSVLLDVMLEHSVPVEFSGVAVDTCGTGGDGAHTLNISTMAAVVVAAAGVNVIKHGNRAASSKCGSADVLEALGIPLDLAPDRVGQVVKECGVTFCFAPTFHPALRFAGPVRRELGIRTVFNVLGPLANPAKVRAQVVGVSDPEVAPVIAGALAKRGVKAIVLRGQDGLDEFSVSAPTDLWLALDGTVKTMTLSPSDFGIDLVAASDLAGDDAAFNAEKSLELFSGGGTLGLQQAVALNAAAAMVAARAVSEAIVDAKAALQEEFARAMGVIASGSALEKLKSWQQSANAER